MEIRFDVDPRHKIGCTDNDRDWKRRRIIRPKHPYDFQAPHIEVVREALEYSNVLIPPRRQIEFIRDRINKKGKVFVQCRVQIYCWRICEETTEHLRRVQRIHLRCEHPEVYEAVCGGPGPLFEIYDAAEARLNTQRRFQAVIAGNRQ